MPALQPPAGRHLGRCLCIVHAKSCLFPEIDVLVYVLLQVRVLREKLDNMRRTLDERRADLTAYKEQVQRHGTGRDAYMQLCASTLLGLISADQATMSPGSCSVCLPV
jgi:hypothetical protein